MNWQGRPDNKRGTEQEIEGARYCAYLLSHRPRWSGQTCIWFGEQVYKRFAGKNYHWADGFREAAYIVARTR